MGAASCPYLVSKRAQRPHHQHYPPSASAAPSAVAKAPSNQPCNQHNHRRYKDITFLQTPHRTAARCSHQLHTTTSTNNNNYCWSMVTNCWRVSCVTFAFWEMQNGQCDQQANRVLLPQAAAHSNQIRMQIRCHSAMLLMTRSVLLSLLRSLMHSMCVQQHFQVTK